MSRDIGLLKGSAAWIFIVGGLAGAAALLLGLQAGERAHGPVRRRIRAGLRRDRARAGAERSAILAHIEERKSRMAMEAARQDYP